MFWFRKPALSLESLDVRLRAIEERLIHADESAIATMRSDLRRRTGTLAGALRSYSESSGLELPPEKPEA